MSNCPCGNDQNYENCCEIFHSGKEHAASAEQLMRARYSAFVKSEIDYVEKTHVPGTTDFDPEEAKKWAASSEWLGLEIIKTEKGQESDKAGLVEFKAKYKDKESDKTLIHHEISTFKNIDGIWYYNDGQIVGLEPIRRAEPKVGRNDPCPCGSGKKFKKCCAA